MEAKVERIDGDIAVIHIGGRLLFERVCIFRRTMNAEFLGRNVIFNLNGASFVGSTGVTTFLDVVRELVESKICNVRMCCLSSEYAKIFIANPIDGLSIHKTQSEAEMAFLELSGNAERLGATDLVGA